MEGLNDMSLGGITHRHSVLSGLSLNLLTPIQTLTVSRHRHITSTASLVLSALLEDLKDKGYRRLSFDIIAHRQIRQKVKDRWKHILEVLGFKVEADGLLNVTSCTSYESLYNPQEARRLHTILAEETSIFGHHHCGPPERYLFVLDQLILLDVGDDFLSAARHFYHAEEKRDNMSSSDEGPSAPGPILVQLNNETQKEAKVEEGRN